MFLCFYVLFGALVLAQRWPPFARHVRPRAVLAPRDADAAGELPPLPLPRGTDREFNIL